MHPRTCALIGLVASACGRLSFDPAATDARTDGSSVLPDDAFDPTACRTVPNLVAFWPFDETSGTVAHDYSASMQDGALMGGASFVPGRIGGALQSIDGATVVLAQTAGLSFGGGTGSFTFAYWVKPDSLTNVTDIRPFELAYCTGVSYVLTRLESTGVAFLSGYDFGNNYARTTSSAGAVQIGRWTHVAHVMDRVAQTGQTFIDGVPGNLDDTSAWIGTIDCSAATNVSNLGGWGGFGYVGQLDDVRIYDRALTASEVQRLAAMTATSCP